MDMLWGSLPARHTYGGGEHEELSQVPASLYPVKMATETSRSSSNSCLCPALSELEVLIWAFGPRQ